MINPATLNFLCFSDIKGNRLEEMKILVI